MATPKNMANARSVLSRDAALPALPDTLSEILQLTEDKKSAMSELADVIERDPALTARLLKVSNSPFYGMRQQVATLKLALVILGLQEVRNLVLSIRTVDALRSWNMPHAIQDAFWEHSVYVGAFARHMSIGMRLGYRGEAFAAGLLHDMGKLLMYLRLGDRYTAVLDEGEASATLCRLEANTFGFTHADAAAVLASSWDYPRGLVDALGAHHHSENHPLKGLANPQLAAIVRLANRAARIDPKTLCHKETMTASDMEAWEQLQGGYLCSSPEEREELLFSTASKLREAPLLFI